jgi:Apea-like HEPN
MRLTGYLPPSNRSYSNSVNPDPSYNEGTRARKVELMEEHSEIIPLVNLSVGPDVIVFEGTNYSLRIREITESERSLWMTDPTIAYILKDADLAGVVSAVEILSRLPGTIFDHDEANEDFFALLAILNVRMQYIPWTPFVVISPAAAESGFLVRQIGDQVQPTEFGWHAHVNVSDRETVELYWNRVTGSVAVNRSLRRALSRFVRARAAPFAEDAIVHVLIGLEALFGDAASVNRGKTEKVTKRAAIFVVDPSDEPEADHLIGLRSDVEALYKPRHIILHGGDVSPIELSPIAHSGIQQLQRIINIVLGEGFDRLEDVDALAKSYDDELFAAWRREKKRSRGLGDCCGGG